MANRLTTEYDEQPASDGMPISQVAQEIGFAVSHYFSSVFKETVGLTPREFKEQCKFGNCSPNH